MESKTSAAALTFARSLRLFQNGALGYGAFLADVGAQLAAGASPGELREILRRRETIQPLLPDARQALLELLEGGKSSLEPRTGASARDATARDGARSDPAVPAEAATIVLDEEGDASHAATIAPASVDVGDVLDGRYQLLELIGEGGMSRVYRASDAADLNHEGTPVIIALKVMNRIFDEQADSFQSFQEEIVKLRSLVHPNIVLLLDCGREDSAVFVTMEYLAGMSLYHRVHAMAGRDALSPPAASAPVAGDPIESLAILRAIADALEYAHSQQVVHGDLKPGNVIVTEGGDVKVIDFGIASWIARPRTALERREAAQHKLAAAVTPRYASPQLMARNKPEPADDVYALACVAYELFTGVHPFDDGSGSQTLRRPPPLRPGLTQTQYDAIVKGLEFERRNRTATVREFMDQLNAVPRRGSWPKRVAWLSALVVLLALGGYYGHDYWYQATDTVAPTKPTFALAPEAPAPAEPLPAPQTATTLRDCPTCPQMIAVPAGHFDQGSANEAASLSYEKPRHAVTIAAPLLLSVYDITVGDFSEFIAATGREVQGCDIYDGTWHVQTHASWKAPGFAQTAAHPVTCVSWNDAQTYAEWLSVKTGHRYRLPSASEWEYAARAGTGASQPWDDQTTNACAHANVADQSAARRFPGWDVFTCDDGFVNTAPVGSFKANAFGLYDMLGNVFQWTQDCWHDNYAGAPADGSARSSGICSERELRGGSWFSSPSYVRAAYRNHFAADYRTSSVGFRLVRENDR